MTQITSGVTDQGFYFVGLDSTDLTTRETGLSSFTVVRSRNGAADASMTTPTITELDNTTMPGVYFLLCDEDTTLASGNDEEEMCFHITHAGMHPVTKTVTLVRPKITAGETVTASGGSGNATVVSINADAITAASIASDAITDAKVASDVTIASVTGSVGSVTGAVGSVTGAVGSVTGNVGGDILGELTTLSAGALAAINAQADTALTDYGALKPTVAGRTLDVSAGGEAGVDWANVGTPSSSVTLSNTSIATAAAVTTVNGLAAGVITAASIAADAITDAKVASDVTIASVTGAVGSVTGNVGGNVTGSVGSLGATAKSDVNAEVLDVLNVDTFAEIGQETPAATQTLRKMIAFLYKAWRNVSTQTSSQYSLMGDDGTTVHQKAAVSDDGSTFTRGEVTTGP